MQNFKKTFRCALKIASPVHLGCDDVYEPTGFVVDEENGWLTTFDPFQFIQDLPGDEREKLSHLCIKGTIESVLEIYRFFRGKKTGGRQVEISKGFMEHYRKVLALPANEKDVTQNMNQFQICRTAFKSLDNRPYIPGTAVKGAIRTAYLNALAGTKRLPTPRGKGASNELQSKLICYDPYKMETDPFRLVKVSDFMPVGNIRTRIVYAVNKKKKVSDREARGPYQILEVIEPGARFVGEISVEKPQSDRHIRYPATLEAVLKSLNPFYQKENQREYLQLNNIKVEGVLIKPDLGTYALRVGRHAGAESITVNGHRNIRIMLGGNKKPVYKDQATTFWLASETGKNIYNQGLRPFGWTVLERLSPELDTRLRAEEEAFAYQKMLVEQKRLDEAAQKKERAFREKQEAERLQHEKEVKERLEKERQAELDALPEEERQLYFLEQGELNENQVVELFSQLDIMEGQIQIRTAEVLRDYWQKSGKWNKKDCSKKQLVKVKKIKSILEKA